ncbi:MAG: AEC family transporter, partial [Aggregatilineales bacterium]
MLELLEIFVNNILPILMIASVGFIVGRLRNIPPDPVSNLIFYVSSPSFVFYSLYTSEIGGEEFATLFFATMTFQLIIAGIAYGIMRIQTKNRIQRAAVINASFCINAGNFGLSLVLFAFNDAVLSRAVVVMISSVALHYSLGVYVASSGSASITKSLTNVLKTPAVYAVIIAFLLRGTDTELPLALERSVKMLRDMALPLMLMMLGLQLGRVVKFAAFRPVFTGTILKLLVAPFIATGIALLLNLPPEAYIAFVLQASMPTAVLTIIFATQFGLDRNLSLNLIMATTFISPITLSVLILL